MSFTIDVSSPLYPPFIKGMPEKLHYAGVWPQKFYAKTLGIVGSRRLSDYGARVLKELFSYLYKKEVTVVSGFMYGADSLAHELAIESGCKTIAVMPSGCNVVTPRGNLPLYNKILESGGLVISEFEDGIEPQKWTYPRRNKIIAWLSNILLVVEAAEKSGSLITAMYGQKLSKKVYSVPGDIYLARSFGTNKLISKGAVPYVSPENILFDLSLDSNSASSVKGTNSRLSAGVIDILVKNPCRFDQLAVQLSLNVSVLSTILFDMELAGLIYESGGIFYVR